MVNRLSKLLTEPTHELGRWTRFLIFQVRIWVHCWRLLKVNRSGTQAAALSYHSIFGVVPLAIVTLMVFQMFPANRDLGNRARDFLYQQMNLSEIEYPVEDAQGQEAESITVADKLDELSENFISSAHTGAITFVGVILVIYAAIRLLTTIEGTFNTIYHVNVQRSFLQRLINYWALLTLGPILLALGLYVSTQVMKYEFSQKLLHRTSQQAAEVQTETPAVGEIQMGAMPDSVQEPNMPAVAENSESWWRSAQKACGKVLDKSILWLTQMVPFLISIVAFFFLYFVLPNTRVSPGAALWGAFVGALLWAAAKYAFGYYLTGLPGFKVYGILGIIPITVYWIYISWLIVLFGLQLTYATQHIKRLDAAAIAKTKKQQQCFLANTMTVIRVMEYVLNAFERKGQQPVSVERVAYRLDMPTDFTEKILERLVKSGLLCRTDDPVIGFVPSTDGANITLDEITKAIGDVSFAQLNSKSPARMHEVYQEMQQQLSKHTLKEVLNKEEDFDADKDLSVHEKSEEPEIP